MRLSFLAQCGKVTASDCFYGVNLLKCQEKRYTEYIYKLKEPLCVLRIGTVEHPLDVEEISSGVHW